MKKTALLFVTTAFISAMAYSASTKDVAGDTAAHIYSNLEGQPINDGDGVVEKSGLVYCVETGMQAPYSYSCLWESGLESPSAMAEEIFKLLPEKSQSNEGDGVVSRTGEAVCYEHGMEAPFTYNCSIGVEQ